MNCHVPAVASVFIQGARIIYSPIVCMTRVQHVHDSNSDCTRFFLKDGLISVAREHSSSCICALSASLSRSDVSVGVSPAATTSLVLSRHEVPVPCKRRYSFIMCTPNGGFELISWPHNK